MEDYRVEIKVRNNTILQRMEKAGYKTVGEFCRRNNIIGQVSNICSVVAMTLSPLMSDGNFRKCVIKVADILNCDPSDLFTDTQLRALLTTNKRSIKVNEAEMKIMLESMECKNKLLEEIVSDEQRDKAINDVLHELTPREEKVLQMRFGLGEYDKSYNYSEIGEEFEITGQRARQIEARALEKLKSPLRKEKLMDF